MYVGVHVPGSKRRSHHRRHRHHHRHPHHQPGIAEEGSPADNCKFYKLRNSYLLNNYQKFRLASECSGHSAFATRPFYPRRRSRRRRGQSRVSSAFLRNGRTHLQPRRRRSGVERNSSVSLSKHSALARVICKSQKLSLLRDKPSPFGPPIKPS